MEAAVDQILSRRLRPRHVALEAAALVVAFALHLAIAFAAVYGPGLLREPPPPPRVLPVKLVPLRALGVERPPEPRRPRPPAAEPTPSPSEVPKAKPTPRKPKPGPPTSPAKPEAPKPPAAGGPAARLGSPQGSPLGISSALGSKIGVDNPDFTYDYYLARMLAMIEGEWTRPPLERQVEAVIHFRILADGRLSDLELVTSSGVASFDLAGLRAVQNAAPFPPLPASYRSDSLGVNLIVH